MALHSIRSTFYKTSNLASIGKQMELSTQKKENEKLKQQLKILILGNLFGHIRKSQKKATVCNSEV